MAEARTQQEPSMEEILASIRRIISEDGTEEKAEQAAPPPPEPEPEPEPVPEPEPEPEPEPPPPPPPPVEEFQMDESADDDVLELTERVDTPPDTDDIEFEPPPPPPPPPIVPEDDEHLISEETGMAARDALSRLNAGDPAPPAYAVGSIDGSKTLEELVRELLRPMLRDWLNANLPAIVEEIVEREVQRALRGQGR